MSLRKACRSAVLLECDLCSDILFRSERLRCSLHKRDDAADRLLPSATAGKAGAAQATESGSATHGQLVDNDLQTKVPGTRVTGTDRRAGCCVPAPGEVATRDIHRPVQIGLGVGPRGKRSAEGQGGIAHDHETFCCCCARGWRGQAHVAIREGRQRLVRPFGGARAGRAREHQRRTRAVIGQRGALHREHRCLTLHFRAARFVAIEYVHASGQCKIRRDVKSAIAARTERTARGVGHRTGRGRRRRDGGSCIRIA